MEKLFFIATMWILGLRLRSSALATSDFTSWAILLTPQIWNASLIPTLSLNPVFSLFSRLDNCFTVFKFATLSFCCQAWSHNDFVGSSDETCVSFIVTITVIKSFLFPILRSTQGYLLVDSSFENGLYFPLYLYPEHLLFLR